MPQARIRFLDALRGAALLGILLANVRQLLMPWEIGNLPVDLGVGERWAWLDWTFFHAFVDLKFITLFSLLFGIGFALQAQRLTSTGRAFGPIYGRRVLILAILGIAHGVLLYPAEVLFPYAVAGLILLSVRGWSTATLYAVGLWLVAMMILWAYQLGVLGDVYVLVTAGVSILLAAFFFALRRKQWWLSASAAAAAILLAATLMTLMFHAGDVESEVSAEYRQAQKQLAAMTSGESAHWPDEFRVRKAGTLIDLWALHAEQYGLILFYFAILLLWRTLGLFMIGAALHRSGAFSAGSGVPWSRVAWIGLSTGVPLSVLATWLHALEIRGDVDWRFPQFLHELSALPLAAGIAGLVIASSRCDSMRWLWNRIEAAGRMPLTNYIGQSFVVAALAEHWGFGLYGTLSGPAMTLLALAVFAALAEASRAWLTRFAMGPLEWLWRCGTYWRWLPISR